MKNKTDVIKLRIDSEIKSELEKIAESEQRTLAGQIRLALSEWLKTKSARPGRGAAAKHQGNGQHSIQQRQYAIPLDIKE
jgi:hypothetical protein